MWFEVDDHHQFRWCRQRVCKFPSTLQAAINMRPKAGSQFLPWRWYVCLDEELLVLLSASVAAATALAPWVGIAGMTDSDVLRSEMGWWTCDSSPSWCSWPDCRNPCRSPPDGCIPSPILARTKILKPLALVLFRVIRNLRLIGHMKNAYCCVWGWLHRQNRRSGFCSRHGHP